MAEVSSKAVNNSIQCSNICVMSHILLLPSETWVDSWAFPATPLASIFLQYMNDVAFHFAMT